MTAKELIRHLSSVAPNEDVLVLIADCEDEETGGTPLYTLAAVQSTVERRGRLGDEIITTYLVTGDELEDE